MSSLLLQQFSSVEELFRTHTIEEIIKFDKDVTTDQERVEIELKELLNQNAHNIVAINTLLSEFSAHRTSLDANARKLAEVGFCKPEEIDQGGDLFEATLTVPKELKTAETASRLVDAHILLEEAFSRETLSATADIWKSVEEMYKEVADTSNEGHPLQSRVLDEIKKSIDSFRTKLERRASETILNKNFYIIATELEQMGDDPDHRQRLLDSISDSLRCILLLHGGDLKELFRMLFELIIESLRLGELQKMTSKSDVSSKKCGDAVRSLMAISSTVVTVLGITHSFKREFEDDMKKNKFDYSTLASSFYQRVLEEITKRVEVILDMHIHELECFIELRDLLDKIVKPADAESLGRWTDSVAEAREDFSFNDEDIMEILCSKLVDKAASLVKKKFNGRIVDILDGNIRASLVDIEKQKESLSFNPVDMRVGKETRLGRSTETTALEFGRTIEEFEIAAQAALKWPDWIPAAALSHRDRLRVDAETVFIGSLASLGEKMKKEVEQASQRVEKARGEEIGLSMDSLVYLGFLSKRLDVVCLAAVKKMRDRSIHHSIEEMKEKNPHVVLNELHALAYSVWVRKYIPVFADWFGRYLRNLDSYPEATIEKTSTGAFAIWPSLHIYGVLKHITDRIQSVNLAEAVGVVKSPFSEGLIEAVLRCYEAENQRIKTEDLSEMQALQMLYDLYFLLSHFVASSSKGMRKMLPESLQHIYDGVIQPLTGQIDPINYALFESPLQDAVASFRRRTCLLFGYVRVNSANLFRHLALTIRTQLICGKDKLVDSFEANTPKIVALHQEYVLPVASTRRIAMAGTPRAIRDREEVKSPAEEENNNIERD